jgi:hypothetical protein
MNPSKRPISSSSSASKRARESESAESIRPSFIGEEDEGPSTTRLHQQREEAYEALWARKPVQQQESSSNSQIIEFQQLEMDDYESHDEAIVRMFGATRVSMSHGDYLQYIQ